MFHCKWLPSATFYGSDPESVNKEIIKTDHKPFIHHTTICLCPNINEANCSSDAVGLIYLGQKLQVDLCIPCSENVSILHAETYNALLPTSACNIAYQSELTNTIQNNYKKITYTIVSDADKECELFLTVSPYLYQIYEIFYVQLLSCPVGFTLNNGACICDPILSNNIEDCYIDESSIRRPINTWIVANMHANITIYLISDCPMDYCLPYSSNLNLLYPDRQCQFNRTGVLCSQCPRPLSMVFGSSRCVKCKNIHILISIIVIVAGLTLVVSLFILNLTVTVGTINSIILYANIISINDSLFLVNPDIFKFLRVFISFANLDLGIETCFYNGMDSYAKMWLQLFFPCFLIFIAFFIIVSSRYSTRILRLTYARSLPVLATLFLSSYTSVFRVVLNVLFSYHVITQLPNNRQQQVWSIDACYSLHALCYF